LRELNSQIEEAGAQLFGISPDRPAKLRETTEKHRLNFLLFSDSKMEAARAFRIAYRVDEQTLKGLSGFGVNLEDASGEAHHLLPVPAVFVMGVDGMIQFSYAHPDYRVRIPPKLLIAALRLERK
jgi:peroxiredoxin